MTNSQQSTSDVDRQSRVLAALHDLSLEIGTQLDTAVLLQQILRLAIDLLEADVGGDIYLFDPRTEKLHLTEAVGIVEEYPCETLLPGEGLAGRVYLNKKSMIVADYDQWEGRAAAFTGKGLKAVVAVPLLLRNRVFGVMSLQSQEEGRKYSEADVQVAEIFAAQAAVVLSNTRLTDVIGNMAFALNNTLNIDEVFLRILSSLQVVASFDGANIMLIDEESGYAQPVRCTGYGEQCSVDDVLGVKLNIHQTANIREMIEQRKPSVIPEVDAYPGWVPNPGMGWIKSYVGAPIEVDSKVIGIINLDSSVPEQFSALHAKLLQAFADQAAIAIRNARLYEHSQLRAAEYNALNTVALELLSSTDMTYTLQMIARETLVQANAHTIYIYFYDEKADTVRFAAGMASVGKRAVQEQEQIEPRKDGITMTVAHSGEPIIIDDLHTHPRFAGRASHQKPEFKSVISLPLKAADNVIGVFNLFFLERMDRSRLHILELLAAHAAIAIENARLYEQAVQAQVRFRDIALNTSDWLWEIDQTGTITFCSGRVIETLGHPAEQVLGKSFYDFMDENEAGRLKAAIKEVVASNGPLECEVTFRHRAGQEVVLALSGTPMIEGDGQLRGYRGAAKNVTVQQKTRQREKLAFELGQNLTSMLSIQDLIESLVNQTREMLDYYHVHLFLYEPETKKLVVRARSQVAGAAHRIPPSTIDLESRPSIVAQSGRSLQIVISNDVLNDPRHLPNPHLPETHSEVACPLFRGEKLLGVLDVQSRRVNRFDEEETRLLQNLAAQVSIAIENAQLYETLARQAGHLEELVVERTAEIVRERERLMTIVHNVGEGIVFSRMDGTIQYVNPAWERLTGYTIQESIGRNLARDLNIPIGKGISPTVRSRFNEGKPWQGELQIRRPDGSECDAWIVAAPVTDAAGVGQYVVAVMHDITAQKEVERMRTRLLANVSHELRTPITNIKLYHTLLQTGPEEKRDNYLDILSSQTNSLERLVDDLLDISRLDRGVISIAPDNLELNNLIEEAVRLHQPQAQKHDLTLTTSLGDEPLPIFADRERIMQVLRNLLTNAINYTPADGQIDCRSWLDESGKRSRAAFSVKDNGIGISPSDLPFVFERFFRAESAKVAEVPGTGLGLSIVKEIVNMHDGEIKVESIPEKGTTFTVFLPVARPQ